VISYLGRNREKEEWTRETQRGLLHPGKTSGRRKDPKKDNGEKVAREELAGRRAWAMLPGELSSLLLFA